MTALDVEAPTAAAPTYATRRDPSAPTAGGRVAVIAKALGTPLMPWQRYVADVALERHPDDPTRWRYPTVVVTVPRQSGKTTLVRAVAVERALSAPRRLIFATAQTGKDAGERWKDLVSRVEDSPLGPHVTVYRGAGAQALHLPNASQIRSFAPTPKSIHGYTPHLVIVDEAWAFDEAQGSDLMAAIRPAQITLPDRQLWIVSTAGTEESHLLKELVRDGRAAVQDPGATLAYFEWSAPEDRDTYDQTGWLFHPAIGHTIRLEDLAAEAAANTRANFERGFLNRWTTTTEPAFDLDAFAALAGQVPPASSVASHRLAVAFEVARDRSAATIHVAWVGDDGRTYARAHRSEVGVSWLVDELETIWTTVGPGELVCDDYGQNRPIVRELTKRGVTVRTLTPREWADAFGSLLAHIEDRTLVHDGSVNVRAAAEAAATRTLGTDGGLALSRKDSSAPIDALASLVVAVSRASHLYAAIPIF
jgi:Phage terminase-like protein, large subunit